MFVQCIKDDYKINKTFILYCIDVIPITIFQRAIVMFNRVNFYPLDKMCKSLPEWRIPINILAEIHFCNAFITLYDPTWPLFKILESYRFQNKFQIKRVTRCVSKIKNDIQAYYADLHPKEMSDLYSNYLIFLHLYFRGISFWMNDMAAIISTAIITNHNINLY